MNPARYTVVDRAATQYNPKISAVNPRYWVWDNQTSQIHDEFASKRAAADTARDLNTQGAT